jgi:hypothetical protein
MADEPDDLDELLAPRQAAETPGLRDTIFRRTQRRISLRRWSRRAGKLAGVAAVFAIGVGVGVWRSPGERETVLVPVPQVEVVVVPVLVPIPMPGTSVEPPPAPDAALTASRLELDAEQAEAAQAAALYRQAGDRYLTGEQDYTNAARCYRLFLARAGEPALSPEPGDSWLLTSLKNAAFKEKINATPANG